MKRMHKLTALLLTLLLALPLGLLISFGRMAKFRVLRFLTQFYISVINKFHQHAKHQNPENKSGKQPVILI